MKHLFTCIVLLFVTTGASSQTLTVETNVGTRALGYLGLGVNPTYLEGGLQKEGLPEAFDWRSEGVLPEIRNQGSCGSCWSFAITKSLEAAEVIQGGQNLQNLSEQHMVSCNKQAYGCSGGFMTSADYVVKYGITDEASFPYTARNTKCKAGLEVKAKASSYKLLGRSGQAPKTDEVKAAIMQYGPVFVTVAAGGSGWNGSKNEITGCRNRSTNHMVNLVGWTANGKWIMANSWSTGWGDKGYSLIKFGCDRIAEAAGVIIIE